MGKRLGWYRKFNVSRTDGNIEKHPNCEYFVLDLTHDAEARFAAMEYASQCEIRDPQLASDIRQKVQSIRGW
jgi:hypothetical protein